MTELKEKQAMTEVEVICEFMREVSEILASTAMPNDRKEEELLKKAVWRCRQAMHARLSSIWIVNAENTRLEIKAASGYIVNLLESSEVKAMDSKITDGQLYYDLKVFTDARRGVTNKIWENGSEIANLSTEESWTKKNGYYDKVFYGETLKELEQPGGMHPCKQFFGLPIVVKKDGQTTENFGVLKVENKSSPFDNIDFDEPQKKSMRAIAESLAYALSLIRSAQREADKQKIDQSTKDDNYKHLVTKSFLAISQIEFEDINDTEGMKKLLKAVTSKARYIGDLAGEKYKDESINTVNIVGVIKREADFYKEVYNIDTKIPPDQSECMGEFKLDALAFSSAIISCFQFVHSALKKIAENTISIFLRFNKEQKKYEIQFTCGGGIDENNTHFSNLVSCGKQLGGGVPETSPDGKSLTFKMQTTKEGGK